MWEQSKTVFVTLNMPGGSNNDTDPWYGAPTPSAAQPQEIARAHGADLRWLDAAFAQAEADNAHRRRHRRPGRHVGPRRRAPAHQANYEPFVRSIATHTLAFGKPVLLPQRRLARLPLGQPAAAGLDLLHGDGRLHRRRLNSTRATTCRTSTASWCTAARSRSSG